MKREKKPESSNEKKDHEIIRDASRKNPGKLPERDKVCPYTGKCGGCAFQGMSYASQLQKKQKKAVKLLSPFGKVSPIIGMENPWNYRCKVHRVFAENRKGRVLTGMYREDSHQVVPVEDCLIEDEKSQEIIRTVSELLPSFRIRIYNEDSGAGLLRHVLVRKGYHTGETMLIIVASSPVFPSKNNFVKAVLKKHPEITTVILNVNEKRTTMVLGERNIVLYGPGFIYDMMAGIRFRISPGAFFQVNPEQAEKLFHEAVRAAALTGKERVLDTYCGAGVVGLLCAGNAGFVTGAELNPSAIRDAVQNARLNKITNVEFVRADAGRFMQTLSLKGEKPDIVFLDPPRSGSSKIFLQSLNQLSPAKVVYISCCPETLARDLEYLTGHGYIASYIRPVDMFPWCDHIETVCLLTHKD